MWNSNSHISHIYIYISICSPKLFLYIMSSNKYHGSWKWVPKTNNRFLYMLGSYSTEPWINGRKGDILGYLPPLPARVTSKIATCFVGKSYKPSFVTITGKGTPQEGNGQWQQHVWKDPTRSHPIRFTVASCEYTTTTTIRILLLMVQKSC